MTSKPTILLIGGGWHFPISYSKLTQALETAGYEVHVPLHPSMNGARPPTASLAEDTAATRTYAVNLIEKGHTIAALMHSYGGQVGTNALHGLGTTSRASQGLTGGVSHLIYMTAFALPENGSMAGKVEEMGDSALMPLAFDFADDKTVVSRDPKMLIVGPGDEEEIEAYVSTFGRWNGQAMYDTIERCAWREIPVSFVVTTMDMTVPVTYQRSMIEYIRGEGVQVGVFEVETGHCPGLTGTGEVVGFVGEILGR
ncbi:alpha/beta-Hydrolase [Glarea lozoyensis ATCC 20868]|uniref:Alpha/beta-Hydrolase n=1 Tax=Glarea lozoyensis (strain ATCC 20868 / MF5171) TaxID=1116229 RepID=S3CQ93_GLAL2|nr:alpha/beta-Hydrolase [Glarea lozoyensis ATCC 20868]EPE28647.1 alpha/beta-Hydrolase [Glarea lozoyensis ATCC 20868]